MYWKQKKIEWEAQIQSKGRMIIPEELMEAHFFLLGHTRFTFRTMPEYLYEQIKMYWHLEYVADKARK